MDRHTKIYILALVALLLVGKSLVETKHRKDFQEMVQWLNSPEELLEGGGNQEESAPKEKFSPEESKLHSSKDYSNKNLHSQEIKQDKGSNAQKSHENSVGYEKAHKGSQSKDSKSGHHNKKGKEFKEHRHKEQNSKEEDSASKGHKGHNIKSEGHVKKGKNEEGFKQEWFKGDSGRQKKFFDNAEEIRYSSDHDHFLAHHKLAGKGNFKNKAKEDSYIRDNHGKKYHKNIDGNFDHAFQEKEAHGRRKDYGKKSDYDRKGAHEGSMKKSKGNKHDAGHEKYESSSNHHPVKMRQAKDLDKDPVQADSSNIPLATVLEHAGYATKIDPSKKKSNTEKSSDSNQNRNIKKSRLVSIKNKTKDNKKQSENEVKQSDSNKSRNKSRRIPILKKRNRNRGKDSETEINKTLSVDNKREESKDSAKEKKVKEKESNKRTLSIINKRLKKRRDNSKKGENSKPNDKKDSKKFIPIRARSRVHRGKGDSTASTTAESTSTTTRTRTSTKETPTNKGLSKSEDHSPRVSIFILKNNLTDKNKELNTAHGKYAGHKKHYKKKIPKKQKETIPEETNEIDTGRIDKEHHYRNKFPKKFKETYNKETNEIDDGRIHKEKLHSHVHIPVIISDPFLPGSKKKSTHAHKDDFQDSHEDFREYKDSNKVEIKPLNMVSKDKFEKVKKSKYSNTLYEESKETSQENLKPKEHSKPRQRDFSHDSSEHKEKSRYSNRDDTARKPLQTEDSKTSSKHVEQTTHSNKLSDKPLHKERSQISIVSKAKLEPSSTHQEHHKHEPKKYAHFKSHDEGHHKEGGKKVEKGRFEKSGFKKNSESDHGKLHDSKFVDKGKKAEKGHKHEKHYEGHFDKGQKGSKGHAHGKKNHSHKGHSDKE